jgi:MoaA/NifB/PqqE/SkfB family radical SAM enzyme
VTKEIPIKFLHIVTNGTIYDSEIVELLNHIENVEFRFSLESTGREDQFIRWPTNWDEKISILHRYMDELKTSKYYANICLQSLNLLSFQNTIDYLKTLPYEIEVLHNVLAFTDMAALWHSDKEYIKHYLDSDIIKHPALEQHAKKALTFARSNHSIQARYFKDSATIQNKDLEEEFPIWFKYHNQYLE